MQMLSPRLPCHGRCLPAAIYTPRRISRVNAAVPVLFSAEQFAKCPFEECTFSAEHCAGVRLV